MKKLREIIVFVLAISTLICTPAYADPIKDFEKGMPDHIQFRQEHDIM